MTLLEKIISRTESEPNSGCWLWTGSVNQKGYGMIRLPLSMGGHVDRVHCVMARLHGKIPTGGQIVCHTCDTPACCNPDHLWIGSHLDNAKDACRKGRKSYKLSPNDVNDIRKLASLGMTYPEISKIYKIHKRYVGYVVSGHNRKYA